MPETKSSLQQISSGVQGLDELLRGGFITGRMYLVTGQPGTGKTTLGMHFLQEGIANDETVLFIHGEESSAEILENAAQFGIDIGDAKFLDLGPSSEFFTDDESYDLVKPTDIKEDRYTDAINQAVTEVDPSRVFLDPITQLKYIETSEHHYRKRLLSFMRFLKERQITVLATATMDTPSTGNSQVRSLSDGVIEFTHAASGRRIEVSKNRGLGQFGGNHALEIRADGVEVYPRLIPEPGDNEFDPVPFESGIGSLDSLTGGGFERGTVTFISGPPGVGKTTSGALYLTQAATDGRRSVIYLFEEREQTFIHRCQSIGMPIDEMVADGTLTIQSIDPLTLSPEEFSHMVRTHVEDGVELVMIDGFGGYTSAIQGDSTELKRDLHALTRYLVHNEVTVFVTDTIHQIAGISSATSSQISPIADNIMFLSFIEIDGSLRKVIGVLKKRAGRFEHTIREFEITANGIQIGEPMTHFRGILDGRPDTSADEPTLIE